MDGEAINRYELSGLRREISVLFQDYAHYQLTARENIWLGNTWLAPEDETVVEAAQQSGAHKTLEQLPKGYETILGKWFEGGIELSVGEWQKIALARAFLTRTRDPLSLFSMAISASASRAVASSSSDSAYSSAPVFRASANCELAAANRASIDCPAPPHPAIEKSAEHERQKTISGAMY